MAWLCAKSDSCSIIIFPKGHVTMSAAVADRHLMSTNASLSDYSVPWILRLSTNLNLTKSLILTLPHQSGLLHQLSQFNVNHLNHFLISIRNLVFLIYRPSFPLMVLSVCVVLASLIAFLIDSWWFLTRPCFFLLPSSSSSSFLKKGTKLIKTTY